MSNIEKLGFIGSGNITASVVKAFFSKKLPFTIYLSPRSEKISKHLSKTYPNVNREKNNQEVVDKSDAIILAIRPDQLEEALKNLEFKPNQIIISFVAATSIHTISKYVFPATKICRVTPLTTIEYHAGPIVITPKMIEVEKIFQDLGDLLTTDSEQDITSFGCAAATLSSFFHLSNSIEKWLIQTGVSPKNASLYVRSLFSGATESALQKNDVSLEEITYSNETPGGLNEYVRNSLKDLGLFELLPQTLSSLLDLDLKTTSKGPTIKN